MGIIVTDILNPPWTDEQVAALRAWQNSPSVHPYTCGNRDNHPMDPEGDYGVLVPTRDGWVCRHCDYTQNWAHAMSFNPVPEPFWLHDWKKIT